MTGECYLTLLNRQVAEREGFEPSVPVTQYARLAIRPDGFTSRDRLRLKRNKLPV